MQVADEMLIMSNRATRNITQSKFASSAATTHDDRRRRPRLVSQAVGYLLCDDACACGKDECAEPREVQVFDVSRLGVGFLTDKKMQPGTICRIRIGYGPMHRPSDARRACEFEADGTWRIGTEFA